MNLDTVLNSSWIGMSPLPQQQHGPPSLVSTWPSMVTGASDISTDPGCSRAIDPDMALSCSSGRDITMTLNSSTGHSGLDASSDTNWTQVSDLTLGILMVLSGNRSHICQSGPW
ncbi:hypothetical protein NN561_017736 [Cricetulus griseus]